MLVSLPSLHAKKAGKGVPALLALRLEQEVCRPAFGVQGDILLCLFRPGVGESFGRSPGALQLAGGLRACRPQDVVCLLARAVDDFASALLGATVRGGELLVRLLTLSVQAPVGPVALSCGLVGLRRHAYRTKGRRHSRGPRLGIQYLGWLGQNHRGRLKVVVGMRQRPSRRRRGTGRESPAPSRGR